MLVLVIASIIIQLQHIVHGVDCSKYTGPYTPTYTKHGLSNANSYYFVADTYAAGGVKDECDIIGGNPKFSAITDKKPCGTRQWCVPKSTPRRDNGWGCPDRTVDCYHVEHIIPLNGEVTGLEGCGRNTRDIFGNAIMAYGRWNIACKEKCECEKREIYKDIYTRAYAAVARCCGRSPTPPITPSNPPAGVSAAIGITVTLVFLGIFACIALIIRKRVQGLKSEARDPTIELSTDPANDPSGTTDTSDTSEIDGTDETASSDENAETLLATISSTQ